MKLPWSQKTKPRRTHEPDRRPDVDRRRRAEPRLHRVRRLPAALRSADGRRGAASSAGELTMRKLTLDEIQADAARRGGRCLAESYVDSLSLMEWECAQGHRWRAVAHSIRQGHWCKQCADEKLRHSVAALHAVAAERGGRCLTERYSNSQAKLEWECRQGHQW